MLNMASNIPINILITGAQLNNKGAESMLYITVDEMKKRFPNSTIYFASGCDYNGTNFAFEKLIMTPIGLRIAKGGVKGIFAAAEGTCKDAIKICLGKRNNIGHNFDVKKIIHKMDLMIDVSGFNLGNQWNKKTHQIYLDRIELAKKNNIPVYLMPQSFGPFDYKAEMKSTKKRMAHLLQYPNMIFAREKEGYEDLINTFALSNVKCSTDLVLQNTGVNLENIFINKPLINVPKVESDSVVGIIPNQQCYNHGDKKSIIDLYTRIIKQLLSDGNRIIIFRHSKEDLNMCTDIYDNFRGNSSVLLETKEFSCLEYDEYVKQFSFIICSRFHGIVHAYRNYVPAIALGWAIKYKALARCVNQEQYSFDITDGRCSPECVISAVCDMEKNYLDNKRIIKTYVTEIQKDNCFDQIKI